MLVDMQLSLPRDARYVAIMRNVANCILTDLKAPEDAREDLQLAITEACANAVKHATTVSDYQVRFAIDNDACIVEIVDCGPGFDPAVMRAAAAVDDESGRGLFLIDALVDDLQFIREEDETKVRLLKRWPELRLPEPVAADS